MTQLFGKANPAYRGGVTNLRTLIRNSRAYKQWRELCFQRDRYKCTRCGMIGDRKSLEAHHTTHEFGDLVQEFLQKYQGKYELPRDEQKLLLLSQAYAPFWSMKIATSLCRKCHKEVHAELKEASQKAKENES